MIEKQKIILSYNVWTLNTGICMVLCFVCVFGLSLDNIACLAKNIYIPSLHSWDTLSILSFSSAVTHYLPKQYEVLLSFKKKKVERKMFNVSSKT